MASKASALEYVDDSGPGITRKRAGHGWAYFDPNGKRITDRDEIDRLNRIALPPAYTSAWYCPKACGHILATGIDAKGRKQYRYNPEFRTRQEAEKFDGCAEFGRLLPKVRKRVEKDLASNKLTRERAIASVVRLLDLGAIRVGNESYAQENKSFGATTLRMRHAKVSGGKLRLRFKAKSGQLKEATITDRALIRFVRRMQDLPGQELFCYVDEAGVTRRVESADVNAYLKESSSSDFTSKDFRTWAGTVLAARALRAFPASASPAEARRNVGLAIEAAAKDLGNTKAVCRKCYVHPAILASYLDGTLTRAFERRGEEAAVLALLRARAKHDARTAKRSGADGSRLLPVLARSLAIARKQPEARQTARALR